ncbi:MAG: PEP-CTERM sorting domain-containing protein [Alistipes sp.]|nr:PEP-CTERM sorting domain-containing protein [Alistipes sp.]
MKLHLPKSLFAVVATAITYSQAYAEYITSEPLTETFNTPTEIVGSWDKGKWVKVESQLTIGDGNTETTFKISNPQVGDYKYYDEDDNLKDYTDAFIIEGEGASVSMNKATLDVVPDHSQLWVGYGRKGGSMTVDNSRVDIHNATTLGIGDTADGNLKITNNSTFIGGYNNLWMYDGSITVEKGSSLDACTDTFGYNYRVLTGCWEKSKIEVTGGSTFTTAATQFVTNFVGDSQVDIIVDGENSVFKQEGTTRNSGHYQIGTSGVWEQRDGGWYDVEGTGTWVVEGQGETITYLCDAGTDEHGRLQTHDDDNSKTNITATNGGEVIFDSSIAYIGSVVDLQKGRTDKTATFTVGEGSLISFNRLEVYAANTTVDAAGRFLVKKDLNVYEGAKITNENKLEAGSLNIKGGTVINKGKISGATAVTYAAGTDSPEEMLITISKGQLQNYGEVAKNILITGGTLTLEKDAIVAAVTMNDGKIEVKGTASTNALTLNGGTIVFDYTKNVASMDLGESALSLGDGVSITLKLSDKQFEALKVGDSFDLFIGSHLDDIDLSNVTVTSASGNTNTTVTFEANRGTIYVVPEPTTATLSLLALAGMAARRRRK